jgi:hypothetical protein
MASNDNMTFLFSTVEKLISERGRPPNMPFDMRDPSLTGTQLYSTQNRPSRENPFADRLFANRDISLVGGSFMGYLIGLDFY